VRERPIPLVNAFTEADNKMWPFMPFSSAQSLSKSTTKYDDAKNYGSKI